MSSTKEVSISSVSDNTEKDSLFPILLVNFIGALGYSLVLPFLIILVLSLGGNEVIYGILGATYSLFQLIGAPVLGKWSDEQGRKKILLLSQAGTFIAWLLFLVALLIPETQLISVDSAITGAFILTIPLALLFIARALDGITGGNISVANAYLSDISTEKNRKSNFGKMAASANLGFIVGPALAGLLGSTILEEKLPVMVTMGISLIAILVIQFMLKESNPCAREEQTQTGRIKKVLGAELKDCYTDDSSQKASFIQIIKMEWIGFILILYFLIFLSFNFFYVAFPVHAIQALDWDLFQLGIFFSVMGGILVFVQGPVLTWISDKVSEAWLIILGSTLLALGFFFFTNSELWKIYVAVTLFALGNGVMWPSFLTVLSQKAGKELQGVIQGYASSTGSLASIIGLLSGGVLYSLIGGILFLIPAILMALIGIISLRFLKS